MGVNTDGEEMGPGSTVTDGVEFTEKACEFVHQHENEQSLPQDADCDVGIQDQKPVDGPRIPLISSLQSMPSQYTSVVSNTEQNAAHIEYTDGARSVPSNTPSSLRPDAALEDRYPELPHGTPVFRVTDTSADDTCIPLEESTSPLQQAEIMEILKTDTNDALDAMYNTILDVISPTDASVFNLELPFNPDMNEVDEEGYTPLYKAALEGHLEGVDDLISQGANPNKPSKGGLRPLHAAAREGHAHIVDYLIVQGADVNAECDLGQTPLHTAAANGYVDILESFIAEGSDLNQEDNTGWTPFNAAIQYGHKEAVKYLMTKGATQHRYDGMTPLYAAAQLGHYNIVKLLISNGADVNEENDKGMIPLHGAASGGHLKVMEYLIQQGSDTNKGDYNGWTPLYTAIHHGHLEAIKSLSLNEAGLTWSDGINPLYMAAYYGHLDIVEFLRSQGIDVNKENKKWRIPLHAAAANGHLDVTKYLFQVGSDINKEDEKGWTPLHTAIQYGHVDVVKYLLSKGGVPTKYSGMTPLYMAAQYGHLEVVNLLISKGADVNEEDMIGQIPLHAASTNGSLDIIRSLILKGSDVNKTDNRGTTPLHAAVHYGHFEVVKHLVTQGARKIEFEGMNPLYMAAHYGHLDIVKFFVSHGLDVNEEDSKCRIPLHAAAANGHTAVTRYLTEVGSNVDKKNNNGWTSFHKCNKAAPSFPLPIGKQPSVRQTKEKTHLSSLLTDGSELPMKEHSSKSVAQNMSPSGALRRPFEGDLTSRKKNPANSSRKAKKKRLPTNSPSSTILVLINTFLKLVLALAILLGASPVLVAGSDITGRVTLQAGKPGVVPFHLPWSPRDLSQAVPYYTLRFESNLRPFCINGQPDIEGFKNPSQVRRFSTSVTDLDSSPCVKLNIDNVDSIDEGGYVLTAVLHSFENSRYETVKKEINVQIPPGPAKCFITLSGNVDDPYEVHCRATSGSVKTRLSCYQNDQKIDVKGNITNNGLITRGIFLLPDNTHFSCCSHDVFSNVSQTMCRDFAWPLGKETTTPVVNTLLTLVTKNINKSTTEHLETTSTTQIESHIVSGACRQFMLPSLWHFTYLFVYLAFVTIY